MNIFMQQKSCILALILQSVGYNIYFHKLKKQEKIFPSPSLQNPSTPLTFFSISIFIPILFAITVETKSLSDYPFFYIDLLEMTIIYKCS